MIGTGGDDVETSVFLQMMTENRQQICGALGGHLAEFQSDLDGAEVKVWETHNACGLSISTEASVDDPEEEREKTRTWLIENLARFKTAVQPYLELVITELPDNGQQEGSADTETGLEVGGQ